MILKMAIMAMMNIPERMAIMIFDDGSDFWRRAGD